MNCKYRSKARATMAKLFEFNGLARSGLPGKAATRPNSSLMDDAGTRDFFNGLFCCD